MRVCACCLPEGSSSCIVLQINQHLIKLFFRAEPILYAIYVSSSFCHTSREPKASRIHTIVPTGLREGLLRSSLRKGLRRMIYYSADLDSASPFIRLFSFDHHHLVPLPSDFTLLFIRILRSFS